MPGSLYSGDRPGERADDRGPGSLTSAKSKGKHHVGAIIGLIIFGAVIGVLARLVLPGRQQVSVLVTVLLGIAGALIGYWISGLLGVKQTNGIDWIRWIISIAVAAVLVVGYERVMSGRRSVRA
jgi:uncharacterized membrane protein YeaQ/YmgE (transglycosylase-associated protein family)